MRWGGRCQVSSSLKLQEISRAMGDYASGARVPPGGRVSRGTIFARGASCCAGGGSVVAPDRRAARLAPPSGMSTWLLKSGTGPHPQRGVWGPTVFGLEKVLGAVFFPMGDLDNGTT